MGPEDYPFCSYSLVQTSEGGPDHSSSPFGPHHSLQTSSATTPSTRAYRRPAQREEGTPGSHSWQGSFSCSVDPVGSPLPSRYLVPEDLGPSRLRCRQDLGMYRPYSPIPVCTRFFAFHLLLSFGAPLEGLRPLCGEDYYCYCGWWSSCTRVYRAG